MALTQNRARRLGKTGWLRYSRSGAVARASERGGLSLVLLIEMACRRSRTPVGISGRGRNRIRRKRRIACAPASGRGAFFGRLARARHPDRGAGCRGHLPTVGPPVAAGCAAGRGQDVLSLWPALPCRTSAPFGRAAVRAGTTPPDRRGGIDHSSVGMGSGGRDRRGGFLRQPCHARRG